MEWPWLEDKGIGEDVVWSSKEILVHKDLFSCCWWGSDDHNVEFDGSYSDGDDGGDDSNGVGDADGDDGGDDGNGGGDDDGDDGGDDGGDDDGDDIANMSHHRHNHRCCTFVKSVYFLA